jgi:hypothetical protein
MFLADLLMMGVGSRLFCDTLAGGRPGHFVLNAGKNGDGNQPSKNRSRLGQSRARLAWGTEGCAGRLLPEGERGAASLGFTHSYPTLLGSERIATN